MWWILIVLLSSSASVVIWSACVVSSREEIDAESYSRLHKQTRHINSLPLAR
jgi:hypothetical protein